MLQKDRLILFLDPVEEPADEPVEDGMSRALVSLLQGARTDRESKGHYRCTGTECHQTGGYGYLLPNGYRVHSLGLHFLRYHRREVPPEEIRKIRELATLTEPPAVKQEWETPDLFQVYGAPPPSSQHLEEATKQLSSAMLYGMNRNDLEKDEALFLARKLGGLMLSLMEYAGRRQ